MDEYYKNVDVACNMESLQIRDLEPFPINLVLDCDNGIQFLTNGIVRMAIKANGDFIVNDTLVENDIEVYKGFKTWLESTLQTTLEK